MSLSYWSASDIASDPRRDYGKGRRCERGAECVNAEKGEGGIVSRWQDPCRTGDYHVLLCYPCQKKRIDEGTPLHRFASMKMKSTLPRGSRRGYARGVKPGIYLPGLRDYLKRKKITVTELSEYTQVSYHHVAAIRSGRKRASEECAQRIADALGVAVGTLTEAGGSGAGEEE